MKIFGVTDPQDVAWVARTKCTSHTHFRPTDPLYRNGGAELPRTYVHCTNPPTGSFDQFAARARDPGWKFTN